MKTQEIIFLRTTDLYGQRQFRIIPSVFPPINFFEDLVDPEEMEMLWEIESLTNERLRHEAGDIQLVAPEDRICGPGSSIVMAAFTHIHYSSRFSNGEFGIYYAALARETAIRETVYHRERFLQATHEPPGEIAMRVYEGQILKPLQDLRSVEFKHYHHPDDYTLPQRLGKELKAAQSWGVIYNSVRHTEGFCIAALRPPAVSIPLSAAHLRYVWNGMNITAVLEITAAHIFETKPKVAEYSGYGE